MDLHGNLAAALTSDEATVTHAIRYDPYGMTLATGSAGGTPVAPSTWTYQGRLDVSSTGTPLLDAGARFYAPGLSAFTQLDTVMGKAQDPRSMNRFLYAEANPATLTDPTGHFVAEYDTGPTAAHDPNGSCRNRGDYGCGRTAANSRAKVQTAAKKPTVRPAHFTPRLRSVKRVATGSSGGTGPDASGLDCSARDLNCTYADIDSMSMGDRVRWVQDFQNSHDTGAG